MDLLVYSLHNSFFLYILPDFLRFMIKGDEDLDITCGFSIGSLRESWILLTRGNFL